MFIGEIVMPSETVYTPNVPRGGSEGVFSLNVLKLNGGTMKVAVEEKNFSDNLTASWGANGDTLTITTAGVQMLSRSQLKEQVRMKIMTSSGNSDWGRVFVYTPTWES